MPAGLLAHAAAGFGALGFSPRILLYLGLALVAVVALGLRVAWPAARHAPADPDLLDGPSWPPPGPVRAVARTVTLAVLALALAAGWLGSSQVGANPLRAGVFTVFWLGGLLVALLFGDLWRLVSPFDTLAAGVDRLRSRPPHSADDEPRGRLEPYVPATLLATFLFVWLPWIPEGVRPRTIAGWLTAYTAVLLVGAVVWGRGWVRRNEAFGVVFGVAAAASPVGWDTGRPRLRNPLAALARRRTTESELAVALVLIGGALFDAVQVGSWWAGVTGGRTHAVIVTLDTAGLFWLTLLAGVVWVGTTKLAVAAGGALPSGHDPRLALAAPLGVIGAGLLVAHEVGGLLVDAQVFWLLASDPFAQGWDLFGTSSVVVDEQIVPLTTQAWISLALATWVLLAAVVAFHDRAMAWWGTVQGRRVALVTAGFVEVAMGVGLVVMLGV